ncbi:MAG: type IX secretion system protein PorQ [Paludibacteraceae bacterium]|nr:type IX secretion system protein PorQ [Paludibacteraceae bacterium]
MNKYISTVLLVVLVSGTASAQAGASVFSFLGLPASARMNALGGSNVSLNEGELSAFMCNPALLSDSTDKVIELGYGYYGASQHFGSVAYSQNYEHNYFAGGIHYLNYGSMKYADEYGNLPGGTFTAQDILINIAYARQLGPMFTVGVSLKPVISAYEVYNSFALGADVGGHFVLPGQGLDVGLSLQNIGWQLKGFFTDENGDSRLEMLPLNLQLGLSYKLPHAPIRFCFTAHNLQRWNLDYQTANIGIKKGDEKVKYYTTTNAKWYDMLFRHTIWAIDIVPKSNKFWITLSYNHRRRQELNLVDTGANVEQKSLAGFALGAGINIKGVRAGVAASQYTRSNYTFQFSLSLDVNQFMK